MRTIRFGRTGVQVPVISLGTWGHGGPNMSEGLSVGWSGHDDTQAKEAILEAYRGGIRHWDTADAYGDGHAERLIGDIFREGKVPRQKIFLATKFGWIKGPSGHYYDPAFMRAQCEASLRNMNTDAIDLYYFHHCDFGANDESFEPALATMRALKAEGKVRFIGLSDWSSVKIMKFIERVDPDVVQPYFNILDGDYESSGLQQYVEAHDLGVAFFSPLKQGLLLGKYDKPVQYPEGDVRSRIAAFTDPEFIARMRHAAAEVRKKFAARKEPVLNAVTGALLAGNPSATVLLGQRNAKQAAAAAAADDPLTVEEAAWVKRVYGGQIARR